jgi:N-methylhydantoinase B/oxoprolinase/acetone carboxylase alpha subunit
LIAPDVPNNAGSLEPFKVLAPEGSIVNPQRPSPVTARHVIGQMLPDLMFGCLEQALDGQVPAESAGSIWVLAMSRAPSQGRPFNVMSVGLGGTGARPTKDGLSTTAFPSGVGGIPVEITESQSPLIFWVKEYLQDSAGAGMWRGGLSQRIVIGSSDGVGFDCSAATFDRRAYPARGRSGGLEGMPGKVEIQSANGDVAEFEGKGTLHIPALGKLSIQLPGGGGFGYPDARDITKVQHDVVNEYVSARPKSV